MVVTPQPSPAPRSSTTQSNRRFHLPGSTVPLALLHGIFFTKACRGISIGMQPILAHNTDFAPTVSTFLVWSLQRHLPGACRTPVAHIARQNGALQTA